MEFLAEGSKRDDRQDLITGSIRLTEMADGERTGIPRRVQEIAQSEIEDSLGPADFRHADEDGGFLFCFSDSDLDQAEQKTAAISDRIKSRMAAEVPQIAHRFAVQPTVAKIDRRSIIGSELPPLEALIACIDQISSEQYEQSVASRANDLRRAQLLFQPAWSLNRGALSLNRCFIERAKFGTGAEQPSPDFLGRFDAYLLTRTVECLHAANRKYVHKAAVLVPVHYQTLESLQPRREFMALFKRIPDHYARQLYFEVQLPGAAEIPLGLKATLDDVAPVLHQLVLQIPDFEWRLIEGMRRALVGVSCSLAGVTGATPGLESKLRRVTEAACRAQLLSVARGANRLGVATAARHAGFEFIIGTAVFPTQDEPRTADSRVQLIGSGFSAPAPIEVQE